MTGNLKIGFWLLLAAAIAPAQETKRLTARELFYTPVTDAKPAAAAAAAPKKPATPPVAKEPSRVATAKSQSRPATGTTPVKDPGEPAYRASQTRPAVDSTEPAVLRVSSEREIVGPPLALRYSLLRMNSDGEYVEVDPETVFRSGDKIRVAVETNDSAYLYIAHQGSSNSWAPLFPNEDTEAGDNRVRRNRRYMVPGTGRFYFDEQPGNERMMIVLSREPVADLEKLIYDLSKGGSGRTSPAATPGTDRAQKMLIASNRIDNSVVDRVRSQLISRDLVYERVADKPAPSGKSEKAMYIAIPDQTAKARLVVDLNLKHQ